MKCEEVHRFLDSYLDGELDLARQLELEQHLAICPLCQSHIEERQEFRTFFAASVPRRNASPELEAKVLAAVRRGQAKQKLSFLRQPWIYAAAALVLGSILALNILFRDSGKELFREAVLHHSRSLSGIHLLDVTSDQPQVVKSWLAAKLAFSPPVVGSPASGCSLIGARLGVIQNRLVAVLVYKHAKDVASLFCWPPKNDRLSNSDHFIDGYHVYTWSNTQCNFIFVSRLSDRAMDEFEDSFRARVQSGAYF